MDTYAYDHGMPCHNSNCKSFGKPHPNCNCYAGGGEVHFCSTGKPHRAGCMYASGGKVDHAKTLGHAAAHHGLLGMLKDVGHAKVQEPEKHAKVLDEAKSHWARMQDPEDSQIPVPKTMGVKLAGHLAEGNHGAAADLMHGHPMMGSAGKKDLEEIMRQVHNPMMSLESNPEALKATIDYFYNASKGHGSLAFKAKSLLDKKQDPDESDAGLRDALDSHLKALSRDPEAMIEIGGSLGHYAPEHAAQLAAMASTAISYFDSLRPAPTQMGSLDKVMPPDKVAQAAYNRQLDVAEQPLLVMKHVKDGTLLPQDVETVKTLYPGLYSSMIEQATETIVAAKEKDTPIPYKQRMALSTLLGEPLDFTMTPEAMQAAMNSQGAQQAQQQQQQSGPKKATDVELRQINKVNEMGETKLEKRQTQDR